MKTERRQIGDFGEGITCRFLMKQGFIIVVRNYLKPWGEIDIVAKKGSTTYFIEVKSVLRDSLENVIHETNAYRPEDNIHKAKLKRLSRTIQTYCLEQGIESDWQFGIAVVYVERGLNKAKVQLLLDVVL